MRIDIFDGDTGELVSSTDDGLPDPVADDVSALLAAQQALIDELLTALGGGNG